ncbi:MAG TPA: RibD family protein, partial [Ferruginibacter sp.]|nr:RibD family protein [Ferruginibacter sp.]
NDGLMAKQGFERVAISNEISNRYTHRLRAHEAAIIVGTNTALYDNPSLTGRLWPGKNPVRIIIDKQLRLSQDSAAFNENAPLIILNHIKEEKGANIYFHKIDENENMLSHLMQFLYEKNLNSLIVEGGAVLLQSFIQQSLWDEAIVINNSTLNLGTGIAAPALDQEKQAQHFSINSDQIKLYRNH